MFYNEKFPNIKLEKIDIISKNILESYLWDSNKSYAIISIKNPEEENDLELSDNIVGIIKLWFHDVESNVDNLIAMSEDDAEAVVEFCQKVLPHSDILIVQCDAGISRSAGVASAISKYYFNDDNWVFKHYHPNMHCYTLIRQKFYESEKI